MRARPVVVGVGLSLGLVLSPPPLLAAEQPVLSVSEAPDELPVTAVSPEGRTLFARGRNLFFNLRLDEAQKALSQAIEKEPGLVQAHVYLALAARPLASGRDSAERALQLSSKASEGERLFAEAVAFELRGDVARELERRGQLVQKFPRDWRMLVMRGNRLLHLARIPEAIADLEHAAEIAPDEAAPYNELGYAYARAGRLDEAVRALKRYAERLPSEPNPHDSLGEILLKVGKPNDAIAEYEKALQLDPSFVVANEGLGHARLLAGDFEGARQAYQQLADKGASAYERLQGRDWLSATFAHEGRFDEMLQHLAQDEQAAVALKDPVWQVLFPLRRALVLSEVGRQKEAVELARKAQALAQKASVAAAQKDELLSRALLVLGTAQARAGDKAAAHTLLELTMFAEGKADGAPQLLGRANALAGVYVAKTGEKLNHPLSTRGLDEDPWGLAMVADGEERLGHREPARSLRQEALKLGVLTAEFGLVRPRLLAGDKNAPGWQVGPVPVTTKSAAALALFHEARRLGEAYHRSLSVAALEKAIALDPDFALARCYAATFEESPEEGAQQLAQAARLAEQGRVSDGERLFIQAQEAAQAGNLAKKTELLQQLAELYPNDWRPQAYLGEHLLRIDRRSEAIAALQEAVARAPSEPYAYNGLGYSLAYEGRFDEAIAALKKYAELSPGESNPHDSLAEVLLLAGRPKEAEAEYRRSLDLSPQFVASWAGIGHARLLAGNAAGAREAYRHMNQLATLPMERLAAQTWEALSYAQENRFDEAASTLQQAEGDADAQKDKLGAALLAARRVPLLAEAGQAQDAIVLANGVLQRAKGKLSPAGFAMVERRALFGRGWAELVAERIPAAEQSAQELRRHAQTDGHPEAKTLAAALEAAVALAKNDAPKAAGLLEPLDQSQPLVQVLLAEAYEQSNQSSRAQPLRMKLKQPGAMSIDLALALRRSRDLAR